MMGSQPWEHHAVLPELQENLEELFPELTLEEALQHQASLYQSLKVGCVTQSARSSNIEPNIDHGHLLGNSSFIGSVNYDLALDEAVARSLQELDIEDEGIDRVAISESLLTASRNSEHAVAAGASITQADAYQDDIDLDQMTYEELQALGEAMGSETQGLSLAEISSLPCYTLKSGGLFSKKVDIGECVICCTAFKNRDSVMALPCAHKYHQTCVERWLVRKKTCPICQKEVKLN